MKKITEEKIESFRRKLYDEEKAGATIEKYIRDVKMFMLWCEKRAINREIFLEYNILLIITSLQASIR